MSISILMQQISVIFLLLLLGAVGFKMGLIRDEDSKFLSRLTTTFLLPCTIVSSSSIEGGRAIVGQMFLCIGLMLALYIVTSIACLLFGRAMHYSRGRSAVLAGTAALPNCGFIGIPLAQALLGDELGLLFATAAVTAYNLWFFTYVAGLFQKERKFEFKSLITPVNISTLILILLLLTGIRLPAPLQKFTASVGSCTTPVALMIVGVSLAQSDLKALAIKPFLYLVTSLRGIIFPLIFMVVLRLVKLDPTICLGMSVLAACPSGNMAAVVAKQNGVEETLCGQAVAHSTLFMLLTFPVMMLVASSWFPLA